MISKAVESQIIDWVKSVANFTNPLAIHGALAIASRGPLAWNMRA
jgi:hypothetical protein